MVLPDFIGGYGVLPQVHLLIDDLKSQFQRGGHKTSDLRKWQPFDGAGGVVPVAEFGVPVLHGSE